MTILKKEEPGIAAFLNFGTLAGCEDGMFRWQANAGMEFYCENLNTPVRRDKIVSALTRATGVPSRFEAVRAGQDGSQEMMEESDQDFLKSVTDTFGAANVSIQDKARS